MSAMEPLCYLLPHLRNTLSKKEMFLLEAQHLLTILNEIEIRLKIKQKNYSLLTGMNNETEKTMVETQLLSEIIKDILKSGQYSIEGIAYYTNAPEEIIYDIASGLNTNPSALLLRKILGLHRSIFPDIYKKITDKILRKEDEENK